MSYQKLVMLSTNPDAFADIINSDMYEGAISSISGVTNFADMYFSMFITLVAFFIISAALLRNVIAGAYTAFPKFWDNVAEAKQQEQNQNLLWKIATFFIPDLKALSDFHDSTIEPKDYFLKAIPQMVVVIMIGIVIYNGYYRDAVGKVGQLASIVIEEVILDVDPRGLYTNIFEAATRPAFTYEDVNTDKAKTIYKISDAVYAAIITAHTDVNTDVLKADLVKNIEATIEPFVSTGVDGRYDSTKYDLTFQVNRVAAEPNLLQLASTDNELTRTFGLSLNTKTLAPESKMFLNQASYIRIVVVTKEKPQSENSLRNLNNVIMTINNVEQINPATLPTGIVGDFTHVAKYTANLDVGNSSYYVEDSSAYLDKQNKKLYFKSKITDTTKMKGIGVSGITVKTIDSKGVGGSHSIRTLDIAPAAKDVTSFKVGNITWTNEGAPSSNPETEVDGTTKTPTEAQKKDSATGG